MITSFHPAHLTACERIMVVNFYYRNRQTVRSARIFISKFQNSNQPNPHSSASGLEAMVTLSFENTRRQKFHLKRSGSSLPPSALASET